MKIDDAGRILILVAYLRGKRGLHRPGKTRYPLPFNGDGNRLADELGRRALENDRSRYAIDDAQMQHVGQPGRIARAVLDALDFELDVDRGLVADVDLDTLSFGIVRQHARDGEGRVRGFNALRKGDVSLRFIGCKSLLGKRKRCEDKTPRMNATAARIQTCAKERPLV